MVEPILPWSHVDDFPDKNKIEQDLFYDIYHGSIDECLDKILNNPSINLNFQNSNGETPLLFSLRSPYYPQRVDVVNSLLSVLHVFVDIPDNAGNTALHEAVLQDNPELLLKLLYKHADPKQKNNAGISCIDLLLKNDCPRIKQTLENRIPKSLNTAKDNLNIQLLKKAANHCSNLSYSHTISMNYKKIKPALDKVITSIEESEKLENKYDFSNSIVQPLKYKYLYPFIIKPILDKNNKIEIQKAFLNCCLQNSPWITHKILLDTERSKDDLLEGFKLATSRGRFENNSTIVHVLLEHGLDAQAAIDTYYYQYLGTLATKKGNKTAITNAQEIMDLLKKFGGKTEEIAQKRKDLIGKVINYSYKSKPKGPKNPLF